MSVIINASTTSGLVMTSDLSGQLQFQNNGVNLPMGGVAPAFSAYASSTTNLSNVTNTKIQFQTEIFDTNNNFASSRFTPTVAGYYQINGTVRADYSTSLLTALIFVNGAVNISGNFTQPASTQTISTCSGLIYLNGTTDYVEIYAFVSGAGNTTTGQASTCFNGCLVRGA